MDAPEHLIRQAEEAERLAALISYRIDKLRLLDQAAALRARAAAKTAGAKRQDRPSPAGEVPLRPGSGRRAP